MATEVPTCANPKCGKPLDRIDHYGIEHLILDAGVYREMNGAEGIGSDVDLRCGYCDTPLERTARQFFYQHWATLLSAAAEIGAGYTPESRERWREEIRTAKETMSKEEFNAWLIRRVNSAAR